MTDIRPEYDVIKHGYVPTYKVGIYLQKRSFDEVVGVSADEYGFLEVPHGGCGVPVKHSFS